MVTYTPPYYWPMPVYTPYGGYAPYAFAVGYAGYSAQAPAQEEPFKPLLIPPAPPKPEPVTMSVPRRESRRPEAWSAFRDRFFVGVTFTAMVGNLLGGLALAGSSLLRGAPALKNTLKNYGLKGIAFAVGLGSLAELGVGLKQKQPTVAIANAIFIGASPYFMKETPFARGLFLFLMGAYYAGYANIIGNKYENSRHTEKREAKAPMGDIPRTAQFIAEDHQALVKTLPQVPALLGGLFGDLKRAAQAVGRGEKLYIEPSSQRVRLSALCHYVGGALLMFAPKRVPLLHSLGSVMAGLGGVSSNLEWFAVGTQRNDAIGTALKVGMPMQALGKMFFHTNAGYGVEVMGQGLSYALTTELNKS